VLTNSRKKTQKGSSSFNLHQNPQHASSGAKQNWTQECGGKMSTFWSEMWSSCCFWCFGTGTQNHAQWSVKEELWLLWLELCLHGCLILANTLLCVTIGGQCFKMKMSFVCPAWPCWPFAASTNIWCPWAAVPVIVTWLGSQQELWTLFKTKKISSWRCDEQQHTDLTVDLSFVWRRKARKIQTKKS